jgi:hypothetical protein
VEASNSCARTLIFDSSFIAFYVVSFFLFIHPFSSFFHFFYSFPPFLFGFLLPVLFSSFFTFVFVFVFLAMWVSSLAYPNLLATKC